MPNYLNIWILVLLTATYSKATEFSISTIIQLKEACSKAQPGDHIIIENGQWIDTKISIKTKGKPGLPVTIRVRDREKHQISGKSTIEINGEHVVVSGLTLKQVYRTNEGSLLKIRGSHCRLTRCTLNNCNPIESSTKYHWLSVYGHHHRIDHCRFTNHHHRGVTLVVWLNEDLCGQHLIDHNYFAFRNKGNANGFETIRIGTSHHHHKDANCMIRQNLFEQCNGELETISNKSCGNQYIGNTFLNNEGSITLRHGNRCRVAYNLFLGRQNLRTAGIRVIGSNHQIIGNHFESLGNRLKGAISISASEPKSKANGYQPVIGVQFINNRFINNRVPPFDYAEGLGNDKRSLLASQLSFTGNQIFGIPEYIVRTELAEKVGEWSTNQYNVLPNNFSKTKAYHPIEESAYQLTHDDVGPETHHQINSNAIVELSPPFDHSVNVDNYAFCRPTTQPQDGTVIDDSQADLIGQWQHTTRFPPYVGSGSLIAKSADAKAVYRYTPQRTGLHEIAIACNNSVNIQINLGSSFRQANTEKPKNDRQLFRKIGNFHLNKNQPISLAVISKNGPATVDAVLIR